jgi:glycolate oxidase iron-sulfur subunit
MRANIDAWWPQVDSGEVEAIVMNASGCGVTVKEYAHHLRNEPLYADKAARISALTRDLSELLPDLLPALRGTVKPLPGLLAFHPPCSLQHGQKLKGGIESSMTELGFNVRTALNESHLCCGSAGTYSVLHPGLSHELRDRKLGHLGELGPQAIISANMGCITHLQGGTAVPVRHWVEVLDEALISS